jgi:hypothetical protein
MKLTRKQAKAKALLALCAGLILAVMFAACTNPSNNGGNDPALTGTVSITGTAQMGQTLTADTFNLNGSGSISYRWLRDDASISGANESSYKLVAADLGRWIKVEVKRSGYSGVVTSSPKGPVVGSDAPVLTGTVIVDGTAQVGQTLTANTSSLLGSGNLSYVWYRDNSPINGATGSSYTLTESDRGKFIKVEISRSGYAGSVFSTSKGPVVGSGETPVDELYPREYWGEWVRMDNGNLYYFSNNNLTVNGQIRSSPGTFTRESDRVMTSIDNGRKYWLYASRPATSRFTGKVADIRGTASRAARAGTSLGGFQGVVDNIKNEADKHIITVDSNGNFEVPLTIAEDEYQISFPNEPEIPPVKVTPGYSGDDIGTISFTEGVNFKISIRAANPQTTDKTRLYADFTPYNMIIDIKNTGTENCTAANFDLNFGDLIFSPENYDKMVGTIVPGNTKSVSFSVACPLFSNLETQSKKDKVIGITINDPVNKRTWTDSVQLQFNKAPVNFNIKSNSAVQGVIIAPDRKAYDFKTAAPNYSTTVTLPWTTDPYLVVFSGATYDTEAKYSLGINVMPDTNFISYVYREEYGLNNTENQAYNIDIRTKPKFMSYLYGNTIQYFKVNLGSTPPESKPVSMTDYRLREIYSSDETVKPGDSAWLDIRFRNNSTRNINPNLTLSTTSSYITMENATRTLGTVNTQNYKTLSSSQSDQPENTQLFANNSTSNAFRFKVADDCPDNTQINFTLNYSESAVTWQDNFTITVGERDKSVTIATPAANNCVLEENGGNSDGKVNPGENAYLRITVRNSGTAATAAMRAELSGFTASQFTANTPTVSALDAGSSAVVTFNLAVNANCPTGTIGPLTFTLTETSGKQRKWWDTVPASAIAVYLKPPAGLKVEPDSQSKARVSWTADNNAQSYKVYHSTNSEGPFTVIGTVTHPAVSYTHSGVSGGVNNYYKVAAVDYNNLESAQSAAVTYSSLGIYGSVSVSEQNGNWDGKINPGETARLGITIRNPGTTAISNLQASLSGFDSNITVSDNSQNISSLNGNSSVTINFSLVINADCPTGPVGPFTLTLNESGGQYRTWLDTVPAFDITIHTPANVQASANAYGSITVSWNAVSGSSVSYKVYTCDTANGNYNLLNTAALTGTSYTHSGLGEGQTRYYKVSAVDSAGHEGLKFAGTPSATSWYTLPMYNDLHDGGDIANGIIYYYRFPVINGTQYKVSWTGNIKVSAYRADNTGTAWFSNSTSSGQSNIAGITGYMVIKVEGTGGGTYSLQIDSGTQALNSFGFVFPSPIGTINGTINHANNTIDVIVPFQVSVLSLTPVISYPTTGDVYCTGYTPAGAQNFTNPREYVFNWSDGSKHTYTVSVTAKGQGDITIIPPGAIEDETVGGFAAGITVSKTGTGYGINHQIQLAAGYSSYEWYVDGARKTADSGSGDRNFTIKAADYANGKHTITIIVFKNGIPYSNEQSFTVVP